MGHQALLNILDANEARVSIRLRDVVVLIVMKLRILISLLLSLAERGEDDHTHDDEQMTGIYFSN